LLFPSYTCTTTTTGRPVKTADVVSFAPATRTMNVRRPGGSRREPGVRPSDRRRARSCVGRALLVELDTAFAEAEERALWQ
jgi:hypothetical protein